MTTVASTFTIWSNRNTPQGGGNNVLLNAAGTGANDVHSRWSSADARFVLPQFLRSIVLKSRCYTGQLGYYGDWITQFQRTPTIALNTADANNFGSDTTPTLEFTGSDADGDDLTYEVQIASDSNFGSGTIPDSYSESNRNTDGILDNDALNGVGVGQAFTANTNFTLGSAKFYLSKFGSPTGNAVAKLYAATGTVGTNAKPTGTALATSDNFDVATLSVSPVLYEFVFTGVNRYALTNGTNYCITLEYSNGDASNIVLVGEDTSSPTHSGNYTSTTNGTTWVISSTIDLCFYILEAASLILDKISNADAGFLNTVSGGDLDPFTQGNKVSFTVQAGDALTTGTFYWRAQVKDPSGSNSWSGWSTARSFTVTATVVSASDGNAAGVGTATGVSGATAKVDASATGVGTANGFAAKVLGALGSASGVGAAAADGQAVITNIVEAVASAAGRAFTSGGISTANLVSCWKLDEASGTRVDSHTSGNDLTDNNTVGSDTGIINNGGVFVAANSEYLSRTSNSSLQMSGNTDFTIAAWVKFATLTGASAYAIVSKDDDATNSRDYNLGYYGGGSLGFVFHIQSGGTLYIANGIFGGTVTASVWYFLVGWYDSSNGQCHLRINDTTTYDSATGATGADASAAQFRIGAREYAANENYVDGTIDEVTIWKRKLTAAEITNLYNAGGGLAYPFLGGGANSTIVSAGVASASGVGAVTGNSTRVIAAVAATSGVGAATGASANRVTGVANSTGVGVANANSSATVDVVANSSGAGAATANSVQVVGALGSATGVGAVTGNAARFVGSVAATTGVGTATANVSATWNSTGSAAGVGVVSGVGQTIWNSVGTTAGVGAATANSVMIRPTVAVAAGVGTGAAVGEDAHTGVIVSVDGNAAGVSVVSGVSAVTVSSVASTSGVGAATANATTIRPSVGAVTGVGTVSGNASAFVLSVWSATGVGTASGAGVKLVLSVFSASGTGAATGNSTAFVLGTWSSSGVGTASAVAAKLALGVWNSSGASNVIGIGTDAAATGSDGNIIGFSVVTGISAARVTTVGSSAGVGTATGNATVISASVGSVSGVGTVSGNGTKLVLSVVSASGVSSVNGLTVVVLAGVYSSSGVAVVSGIGESAVVGAGSNANASGVGIAVANATWFVGATGVVDGLAEVDGRIGVIWQSVFSTAGTSTVTGFIQDATLPTFEYVIDLQVGGNPTQSGFNVERAQSGFSYAGGKSGFAVERAQSGLGREVSESGLKYPR